MSVDCSALTALTENMDAACRSCGRPEEAVRLVAVSKRQPLEKITAMIECGQRIFGENYLQEAVKKIQALNRPELEFHFIGHLQSNKARQAAEFFEVIETVDRMKIARLLDNHSRSLGRRLRVLVQVNVGRERQKHGVMPEKALELLAGIREETGLRVEGLMTMPPRTATPAGARQYFRLLREIGVEAAGKGLFTAERFELSMGMSGDYQVAIEEGATLIRVGTALFGPRP